MSESQNHWTRREILRGAAYGAAAAGLGGSAWAAEPKAGEPKRPQPKLPHGTLGRTGYPVTLISYGAILIAERLGTRVLKAGIDAGINLVHVSADYMGGKSIVSVGDLFKAAPEYRKKVFLCLKSYHPENDAELPSILEKLHTDHADALFTTMDNADPARIDAIAKQQDAYKAKGLIKHTGFVCHGSMNEIMELVQQHAPKYFDAMLVSTAPLGGGQGRTRRTAQEKNDRFVQNLRKMRANGVGILSMKSGARKAVKAGAAVFGPHARVLLDAGVDTVLTSIDAFDQVEMVRGLKLVSPTSKPADRRVDAEFQRDRGTVCLMCADCQRACPRGVPVNDLMRIRMYHDEYGWTEHARAEYRRLGAGVAELVAGCGDCTACTDVCPVGSAGAATLARVVSQSA